MGLESFTHTTSKAGLGWDRQATLEADRKRTAYERRFKRVMDVIGGAFLLLLSLPLLLMAVILVLTSVGSPVLFRQQRVGLDGSTFELYKLRTMIHDRRKSSAGYEGPERRKTHKSDSDPRVTSTAAILRALRLDELPQFVNVIKGDMSLVGPRPELPTIVADYEEWQHDRHTVRPGLTGLWQVSAQSDKLMHECTELDIEYVDNVNFARDLAILLKTPGAMIRRTGF